MSGLFLYFGKYSAGALLFARLINSIVGHECLDEGRSGRVQFHDILFLRFFIHMLTTLDYVAAEVRIEADGFFDAGRADMRAAGRRTSRYFLLLCGMADL